MLSSLTLGGAMTPYPAGTVPGTPTGAHPHEDQQQQHQRDHNLPQRSLFSGGGGMSNSFHMSMTSGTSSTGPSGLFVAPGTQEFAAAVAAAAAQQADEDDRPDNMELLVGDVKGKVSRNSPGWVMQTF